MDLDKHALNIAQEAPAVAPPVRAADAIVDVLVAHGVEVIFGLPGGPISPIIDALLDRPEIRVVNTRSEGAALFAAAGYAHASGKLGVAMVTTGPGVLNALTGLTSAYCDGLPVLLLAGEVARRNFGRGALQDGSAYGLHIVEMLRNVTKYAAEVNDPNRAPAMLRSAIRTAATCLRPARSAAKPAASTSTARRSSITSITSCSRPSCAAAMRNGEAVGLSAT